MTDLTDLPAPNWDRLDIGEFERTLLAASASALANPDQKAKASFYESLGYFVNVLTVGAMFVLPVLIWATWKALA